jgi:asparagine N-glycosylation enzyme membrane subunit Stt3
MSDTDEAPAAARWQFDALTAAPLPAVADPLDGLVAESPPEHTLVGHGLVWTLYASAAVTIATLGYRTLAWDGWDVGGTLFWILALILVLELWLGRAIQKFSANGFRVAVVVLAFTTFGGVTTLLDSATLLESLVGGGGIVLSGTWLKYLLDRRDDFT